MKYNAGQWIKIVPDYWDKDMAGKVYRIRRGGSKTVSLKDDDTRVNVKNITPYTRDYLKRGVRGRFEPHPVPVKREFSMVNYILSLLAFLVLGYILGKGGNL
jgi:hypothetical protein